MVGYSRLMEADEGGTFARHKAHRSELIDPSVTEYNGRIVKTTGDGLLVEFASVVDAVECAVVIQRAMAECEADVPEERRIQYRIGINLGDIIVEDGDIFGDGVNVASRLEGMAEPGGLLVSHTVYESIAGKLGIVFADNGEREFKNIARPVRVWSWPRRLLGHVGRGHGGLLAAHGGRRGGHVRAPQGPPLRADRPQRHRVQRPHRQDHGRRPAGRVCERGRRRRVRRGDPTCHGRVRGRRARRAPHPVPHWHQSWGHHRRRRRYLRRRGQRRLSAGGDGGTRRVAGLTYGLRKYRRQIGHRVRGQRRKRVQKHRQTGPCLVLAAPAPRPSAGPKAVRRGIRIRGSE